MQGSTLEVVIFAVSLPKLPSSPSPYQQQLPPLPSPRPRTPHQRGSCGGSRTGFLHMRINPSRTSITYIIATWLRRVSSSMMMMTDPSSHVRSPNLHLSAMTCLYNFYPKYLSTLNVCHDTRRPSCENKQNRSTFKALSLRRENSPYFRKTGRNPAVVRRRTAIYKNVRHASSWSTDRITHIIRPVSTNPFMSGSTSLPFSSFTHSRFAVHKIFAVCMKSASFAKCLPTHIRRPNPNDA